MPGWMRCSTLVRSFAFLAVVSTFVGSAVAATRAKPMLRVEPSQQVKDKLDRHGTPWQALSPSQTRGYTDAIRRQARASGATPPRQIVSLGGTGGTQQFYVVYPNSLQDRLAPYSIVTVSKAGGKYTATETHESTSLARAPIDAWRSAAKKFAGGYALLHRAIPMGMTTTGSMLFKQVGGNSIAEVGVFRRSGAVKVHRSKGNAWDIRPGADARLIREAGLELALPQKLR